MPKRSSGSATYFRRRGLRFQRGFTIMEVLVAIAILAILLIISMQNFPQYVSRARDNRRKGDMDAIKAALEHYADDNQCYPEGILFKQENCGKAISELQPYLPKLPCDPITNKPYVYVKTSCSQIALFTRLDNPLDASIALAGCDKWEGGKKINCGVDDPPYDGVGESNYGTSNGSVNVGTLYSCPSAPGRCGNFLVGGIDTGKSTCDLIGGDACGSGCPTGYRCLPSREYCIKDVACQ